MGIPCGGGSGRGGLKRGNYGLFFNFELLLIYNRMHLHSRFCGFVDPCWSRFGMQERPRRIRKRPRRSEMCFPCMGGRVR